MALEGVTRGTRKPPRMVVYGPPKIGKSTLGSETPSPVFVTTEDGVDNLPVDQYPRAESWDRFVDNVQAVVSGEHEYQTLVIDTLNGGADLAASDVCDKQFKGVWGPKGFANYGQGWAATSGEMRRLLPLLDAARDRGMMVLCLAHAGVVSVKNPIDGDYTKFAPDLDRRCWAQFAAWADVILRADFEYTVLITDEKTKRGRAVGTTSRILHAVGSAAEDAGCRVGYELPEQLEMSWGAIAAALGTETDTCQQVRDRWSLLVNGNDKKALAFLGIKTLGDLESAPTQKVRQMLNRLRRMEVTSGA